jgi:CRISP-associated protein Cas1
LRTLYISEQGCSVSLDGETIIIKKKDCILTRAQLPLLEQILVFGNSQITTQTIKACLRRNIPIAYLSQAGYCYGKTYSTARDSRHLHRLQQQLNPADALLTAKQIVRAKLSNSRTILQRQNRRLHNDDIGVVVGKIGDIIEKIDLVNSIEQLLGFEGLAAKYYFSGLGKCISNPDFEFTTRSRRPPADPVNAMLSFGYQVLWNHLLSIVELQGLDPYYGCLHQGSDKHPALASDLIEEFRAPIVDSLVLMMINQHSILFQKGYANDLTDFVWRDGGCYLNIQGSKKYLKAFLARMETEISTDDGSPQPKWAAIIQQVKAYKQFIYQPLATYQPYQIR